MYGTRLNTLTQSLFLAFALSITFGCSDDPAYFEPTVGGDYGVTPGGAQNIGYVRDVIEQGGVPTGADIAIEGLLSEHDIWAAGGDCDSLMCARPALARSLDLATGEMAYWLHLGMKSGLSRAEFVRPPLDVVVAIDKSASMSIDMAETNEAVTKLIDNLRDDDRIAIIAFDSDIYTIKDFGTIDDREALKEQVRAIQAGGSWDLERATGAAYDILDTMTMGGERLRRVMMFSCGYPALAEDGRDSFSMEVHNGALAGVGMSFFGVLLGYDSALATMLGNEMGGSFHYLETFDRIVQVFDADFDTMVTPVAYDLDLSFVTSDEFEVTRFFGLPGDNGQNPGYEVDVATAFLSNRGGAIVARLDRVGAPTSDDDSNSDVETVGTVGLSYLPEPALGWTAAIEQVEDIMVPEEQGDEDFYASRGSYKAVTLVNQGQQMQTACDAYHQGQAGEALAILTELAEYLSGASTELNDPSLLIEVALIEKLIENMQ